MFALAVFIGLICWKIFEHWSFFLTAFAGVLLLSGIISVIEWLNSVF